MQGSKFETVMCFEDERNALHVPIGDSPSSSPIAFFKYKPWPITPRYLCGIFFSFRSREIPLRKRQQWRPKARRRCTLARLGYLILLVIFSILLLLNVLRNLDQTRVNARIILMCTRNARRKRGKLDWNATRLGLCSRECKYGTSNAMLVSFGMKL